MTSRRWTATVAGLFFLITDVSANAGSPAKAPADIGDLVLLLDARRCR